MWESIDLNNWADVPCIKERTAEEVDVENGIAVFAIPSGSEVYGINLPSCLVHIEEETENRIPGIIIHAEKTEEGAFLGIRYIVGGNGVCTLDVIEILEGPNGEFIL